MIINKENIGNVLGVVAEYNPFHNGHKYHLERCKSISRADVTVAVMSGPFTQRGEPAIFDKWKRGEMALLGGVDLVIELPSYFAINGASEFAYGAVRTLDSLGVITHLGFGSEVGNIDKLKKIVEIKKDEPQELKKSIKNKMVEGLSYSKAMRASLGQLYGSDIEKLLTSNNILAIEYMLASKKLGASWDYVTVARKGQSHLNNREKEGNFLYSNDEIEDYILECKNSDTENLSGENLRKLLKEALDLEMLRKGNETVETFDWSKITVPKSVLTVIKDNLEYAWLDDWYRISNLIRYKALCSERKNWQNMPSWEVGLEGKFINNIRTENPENILNDLVSKRYTKSRIRRYLLQLLLETEKGNEPPSYIRVLAFNEKGGKLLKHIKKNSLSKAPIITNVGREKVDLSQDIRANDLYNLIMKRDVYKYSDFVVAPISL